MRKKIIIAAAILLLLLLCFWGWLQYRQYSCWNIPVHRDVNMVARINTDALVWDFIKEYGINFSKKISRKDTATADRSKNTGIYFPGSIFIYNISSRSSSTLFCTLPVYKLADCRAFVKDRFNLRLTDSVGLTIGTSENGKITIVLNNQYLSIAYSSKKEEVVSVLMEVLSEKNRMFEQAVYVSNLKKGGHLLSATNNFYGFTADIRQRELVLTATTQQYSKINSLFYPKLAPSGDSAIASFSANIYPDRGLFEKEYHVKQLKLQTDSLLPYYNGNIALHIGPSISQYDSLTTYEYDDNFEKVERLTVQEVKVPDIHLQVAAKPGVFLYLQRQQFITPEGKLNKEIFPLYNVSAAYSNGWLHFTTKLQTPTQPPNLVSSENFMEAAIDVKQFLAVSGMPSLESYAGNVRNLTISGKKGDEGPLLTATIGFDHSAIRDMLALLKSL